MKNFKKHFSYAFSCLLAVGMITTASAFAQTETSSEEGTTASVSVVETAVKSPAQSIAFPVAELGNCANKDECHAYCEKTENMEACASFAQKKGLSGAIESSRVKAFATKIKEGKGPGGCTSPSSCNQYCTNVKNIDECVAFAEKNGLKGSNYEEGKKIQNFLKEGGTTPGNCQTNGECSAYCGQFSHAKECADFAQKAGLGQKEGVKPKINSQMTKLASLAESGETPGQCGTKDECEKYCSDKEHRSECVDFSVKMGFVPAETASRLKQSFVPGPGGCDSSDSCRTFCGVEENKEVCLQYAKDRGLNASVNVLEKKIQTSTSQSLKREDGSFPPAVLGCLKEKAPEVFALIEAGKTEEMTIDMKGKITGCVNSNKPKEMNPIAGNLKSFPPAVISCLKERAPEVLTALESGKTEEITVDMRGKITSCINSNKPKETENPDKNNPPQNYTNYLRNLPPVIIDCVKTTAPEVFASLEKGDTTVGLSSEAKEKITACLKKYQPQINKGEPVPVKPISTSPQQGNFSPMIKQCYAEATGNADTVEVRTDKMTPEVLEKFKQCVITAERERRESNPTIKTLPAPMPMPNPGIAPIAVPPQGGNTIEPDDASVVPVESVPAVNPGLLIDLNEQPMSYGQKFMATALAPFFWIFGK